MRKAVIIHTVPKKEAIVARDLCDCLYYYDQEVVCKVVTVGRVYIYTHVEYLDYCINMKYFRSLIKKVEYSGDVSQPYLKSLRDGVNKNF
ncbi:conserved hypothetical protein [Pyrobaculum islandicum DSM 4184]|uniref:PAE0736-like N-terminal domain-containing protein n=1 Tax=Pyrobaculum islandicum (strain DSM 4184 / JCM 9189 / GEO3) TaxID=384616 RepID=A1RSA4_PYRIL|nr:conserved hypothetical protein [Pyrobaculum islandicum DSM 4184]